MTQPKTLLEMAGASPAPVPLAEAAVLVIDAQREYLDGKLALPGIRPALAEVRRLVALARGRGRPVIHVRHVGRPGGLFDPTGPGGAIVDDAAPVPGEAVVEKKLPNAFAGTDLDARLRGLGVNKLIVVGFMTHMCVSSTVRAALDFGYSCTVVAGGCATRDLPDGAGGAVPAAVLHRAELAALADRFATVVRDCDGLALGAAA
jgi:nicotinamidase-related amidase